MSNTKAGLEWLELMPEPYKEQARANIDKIESEILLKIYFPTFYEFITGAFIWEDSPQGQRYWEKFVNTRPEHLRD